MRGGGGTEIGLFVTVGRLETSGRPSSRWGVMAAAWVGVTENWNLSGRCTCLLPHQGRCHPSAAVTVYTSIYL